MDAFKFGLAASAKMPELFSVMLGLNPNLTLAQFDQVSLVVHKNFPGLSALGFNQLVMYVVNLVVQCLFPSRAARPAPCRLCARASSVGSIFPSACCLSARAGAPTAQRGKRACPLCTTALSTSWTAQAGCPPSSRLILWAR